MKTPIRFSDIEDCERCPLNGDGDLCSVFSSVPHLSEPPCVCNSDSLISEYIEGYMDYQDELIQYYENEKQRKKDIQKRKEKAGQTRFHVIDETRAIKKKRKFIKALENQLRFLESIGEAFSFAHSMIKRKEVKLEENENMKYLRSYIDQEKQKLIDLEVHKNKKLKDYRKNKLKE